MAHLHTGEKDRRVSPDNWLERGREISIQANEWAGRGDLLAYVGEVAATDRGAPALFTPANAYIEVNSVIAFGKVDPKKMGSFQDRKTWYNYPKGTGAIMHEAMHARFTTFSLRKAYEDLNSAELRALMDLEESRIEAKGVKLFPKNKGFLRACALYIVMDILNEDKDQQLSQTRQAARLAALCLARLDAGVLRPKDVKTVKENIEKVIAKDLLKKLRNIWLQFQRLDAEEHNPEPMYALAREWNRLIQEEANSKNEKRERITIFVIPAKRTKQNPEDRKELDPEERKRQEEEEQRKAEEKAEQEKKAQEEAEKKAEENRQKELDEFKQNEKDNSEDNPDDLWEDGDEPEEEEKPEDGEPSDEGDESDDKQPGDGQEGDDGEPQPGDGDEEGEGEGDGEDGEGSKPGGQDGEGDSEGEGGEKGEGEGSESGDGSGEGDTDSEGEGGESGGDSQSGGSQSGHGGDEDGQGEPMTMEDFIDAMMDAVEADAQDSEINSREELNEQQTDDIEEERANKSRAESKEQQENKSVAERIFGAHQTVGVVGKPTGGSRSVLRSTRKPVTEEVQAAVVLSRELQKAKYRDRVMSKHMNEMPPGRLKTRRLVQGAAMKSKGIREPIDPWQSKKRKHAVDPDLTIGVMVDVSGSMSHAMEPMGSAAWILSEAVRRIKGKVAMVYYGASAFPTLKPGEHLDEVRIYTAPDGYEVFNEAFKALDGGLQLLKGHGARMVVVVSDGAYKDDEVDKAHYWMQKCQANGVGVLWLGFGHSDYAQEICEGVDAVYVDMSNQNLTDAAYSIGAMAARALTRASDRQGR